MADERLRLVAEVTDQFTGPLGKMQTALRRTSEVGSQGATALRKDFEGVHTALGKTQGVLQGMTPVLSAFGSGALGAALSLGGVTTALRNFSGTTQALSMMSKETGISIDKLRALGALGERFGTSAESMNGAIRGLRRNMFELHERTGEAYSGLLRMNLGDLVEQLVSAPNMEEALKRVMERLAKIKDPEVRRRAAAVLGAEELASLAGEVGGQYETVLADIAKRLGKTTQQQVDAAKRFEQTLSELRQNIDGLTHEAMAPLLDKMNEFVKALQSPEAMQAFNGLLGDIAATARTTKQEFEAIVAAWGKLKDYFGRGDQSLNKEFIPGLGGGVLSGQSPVLPGAGLEGRRSSIQQQLELLDRNPSAPDYQRKRDRMTEELRRVGDELEKLRTQGGATAQKSAFDGPLGGGGALIQKASYGGGFGLSSAGARGALSGVDTAIGRGSPALSLPSRGALQDRSGSAGTALDTPTANPGAYKDVLDHIARSEGTAGRAGGGYNTSLGYGRYLPGGREQNLTSMTLDEISALGNHMRRQPGNPNSSALGRYQIVGNTMRGLMRRMGLKGSELFDEQMQDRMGAELARGRGTSAAGLGQEWASLRGQRLVTAVDLMRRVDPHASTMPNGRATRDASHPGERFGDAMMRHLYGAEAPVARGLPVQEHRMTIDMNGFPPGARPRVTMSELFKDVNVTKTRQMDTTSI